MKTELRVIALLLLAAGCTDDSVLLSDANTPGDTEDRDVTSVDTAEDASERDSEDGTSTDLGEDSDGSSPDTQDEEVGIDVVEVPNAALRALHLAKGAGAVDLHLNGIGPVVSGLAFADGTAFQPVVGGTIAVDVVPAGQPLENAVLNGELAVAEGSALSVAVLSSADGLSFLGYPSDREAPSMGRVRVRFIHAAAIGPIDVWEGDGVIAEDLAFGAVQDGAEFPAGARRYSLDTTLDGVAEKTCNLGAFPAGTIADVFITGDADSQSLVVWFDNGATVEVACTTIVVPPEEAELRVLNAAAALGPIDVSLSTLPALPWSGLDPFVGSAYLTVPAVTTDLTVAQTGSSEPILGGGLDLATGQSASVIVVDQDPLGASATVVVLDDDREPPGGGELRLRLVHARAGLPAVSATLAGVTLASGLPFGEAAAATTLSSDLAAAPPIVRLTGAGGASPELECNLQVLPSGAILTVVVTAAATGETILLLWPDDGSDVVTVACTEPPPPPKAELRVIQLASNVGAVSASVGAQTLTEALSFSSGTPYATVLAGEATLTLSALDGSATLTTTATLAEGSSTSAIALATAAGGDIVTLQDDRTPPAPGRARIRAFHAASAVSTVDLYAGGNVAFADLAFGTASAAIEVDATAIELGIDTTDDGEPELLCTLPALASGAIVTAFAAPAEVGVQIVLWFDDGSTLSAPCNPPPPEGASLRALHLLSGVAPLNVARGGVQVASVLPSYTGSAFAPVPVTAETVAFTSSTSGAAIATVPSQALVNGASYTAVVLGPSASPTGVLLTDDLSPVPAGQVRGRFVHAVAGTGVIDVYAIPTPTTKIKVTSGLTLGKAGAWLQGANSPVATGVDVGANGTIDWSCPKVPVATVSVTSIYYVLQGGVLKMVHLGDSGDTVVTACTAGP